MDSAALAFLTRLRRAGIDLSAEQDGLRIVAPDGTWTPELRRELLTHKPAILRMLAAATTEPAPEDSAIHRVSREQSPSASFAQERFWFLEQMQAGGAAYHVNIALRLLGRFDAIAFRESLETLVARHEALRSGFTYAEGQLHQVIGPAGPVAFPVVDLSHVTDDERPNHLRRLLHEASTPPFDLTAGSVLRACAWRLGDAEHVVQMVIHHIACDGWSLGNIRRELSALYTARVKGHPASLEELRIQYADFAAWQREKMQQGAWKTQLAYWGRQLQGCPPLLELPTDRPRPAVQTYAGAQATGRISTHLTNELRVLAERQQCTLFMTILSAFMVLLYRHTGQEDIVVGTPVANRKWVDTEPIIGLFANTLALRGDLSGQPSFRVLLARIRDVCIDAYGHQDLPFDKLVQELQPERRLDHHPLLNTFLVLKHASPERWTLHDLEGAPLADATASVRCDLELHVAEDATELAYTCIYNTDLFDAATIAGLMQRFLVVLERIVADPDLPISRLSVLSTDEREALLLAGNAGVSPYPRDRCVHDLFEAQVARNADALAVQDATGSLTYGELNDRADRLAGRLQRLGVGPDVLAALCLERSVDLVVGMLAILKAGGGYVPLDPSWPLERLRFVLADTRAAVLLTSRRLRSGRLSEVGACVTVEEDDEVRTNDSSEQRANQTPSAEQLAYVIYTSGSAGAPKGVAVNHRAVVRLVVNTNYIQLGAGDVVAQAANAAFDAATFEIWGALLNGARLAILSDNVVLSPRLLARTLVEQGITTLFLSTALFHVVAQQQPDAFKSLTHLLVGGDALDPRWAGAVLASSPPARLINAYGPTEATTFATWHEVRSVGADARSIPIGRPLANTQIFILDGDLQPVPMGVVGELYIGGDGLARGYVDRPELTAAAFLLNPFSRHPGERLYKTGDRARYLPDGAIDCLGRLDEQVKIRGFRVELGEIETRVREMPGVQDAVALARDDEAGDRRVILYVIPSAGIQIDLDAIRRSLAATLPDYMIPSAFVGLKDWPINDHGKLDRRALPAPEARLGPAGHIDPSTATEAVLAGIWAKYLGVKAPGIDDNFFDLGGHSLLAVRVQHAIEHALGRRLTVTAFFQAPTIRELAGLLDRDAPTARGVHLFTPHAPAGKNPLFCLHFLSASQNLARHVGTERQVFGIDTPFEDELQRWHTSGECTVTMEMLAARALAMITTIQPHGPYYLAGFCFGGVLAFELARQLTDVGHQVWLLALLDAMYAPGCRPRAVPWLHRAVYHGATALREGPGYLGTKLAARRQLKASRREAVRYAQLMQFDESAREGLPRAAFMHTILERYVGQPYAGDAVVFRGVSEPSSFSLDLGQASGWDRIVAGQVHVEEIPCGHREFFQEPHIGEVASRLKHYYRD